MAGGKQTGWRDGVGADALFYGGLSSASGDSSASSSDEKTTSAMEAL